MKQYSQRYPVWFCDIWGVLHNGVEPFAITVETLARHRVSGGTVILVTNSPRSNLGVEKQLCEIGVEPESHDGIVTSGDVTQDLMRHRGGGKVFHLGPDRDQSIFEGTGVARVTPDEAHAVLCTGLFDDQKDQLADYETMLADLRQRDLPMICANPDKIVRKGDRLLHCAGALAEIYAELGGTVLMAGKPFAPIYDLAMSVASKQRGYDIIRDQVLAIGDGPQTDILGAADYGLDGLLVAEGVTDASAGLHVVEDTVRKMVPHARIVATVHDLTWT
jgi:HAD superfamily hydrolase (TIGR01459 family)